MKKTGKFILLMIAIGSALCGCDENKVILYHDNDTTNYTTSSGKRPNDYNAKIPGLNAQVVDYTLPNEYQHESQLFPDTTIVMSWDDAGFKNANAFIEYFKQIQLLIKDDKKEELASHLDFPLKNLASRKEFIENYDKIFDDAFKYEVLKQDPNMMFRNNFGALAGHDGQMWFKPKGGSYKIIAINF
jgi:hypothetical protein